MGGLGEQARRKGEKRTSAMSPVPEELAAAEAWRKPPKDQCDPQGYTCSLGAEPQTDVRLKLRLLFDRISGYLVEFAVVLQVSDGGSWQSVAEFDTAHADECHVHQLARSTGARIGDSTQMSEIGCMEDVQDAYNDVYGHVEAQWKQYVERWRNG